MPGERVSVQEVSPGVVRCLDLDEEAPPARKAVGQQDLLQGMIGALRQMDSSLEAGYVD